MNQNLLRQPEVRARRTELQEQRGFPTKMWAKVSKQKHEEGGEERGERVDCPCKFVHSNWGPLLGPPFNLEVSCSGHEGDLGDFSTCLGLVWLCLCASSEHPGGFGDLLSSGYEILRFLPFSLVLI